MSTTIGAEVSVDREFEAICELLERDAIDLLREVLNAPRAEDRHLIMETRQRVAGVMLHADVEVDVDPIVRNSRYAAQLPLRWRPVRHRVAFPPGHGTLHVSALSRGPRARSSLLLTTQLEPGLGPIGDLELAIEGKRRLQREIEDRLRTLARNIEAKIPGTD